MFRMSHGKRKAQYETRYGNGNGYLLVIMNATVSYRLVS